MEDSSSIDLAQLAKHLKLDLASLQSTVELLEVGNTVPFITRFRRDQTGGLDEQQIRTIQRELSRYKQLLERKETILKSIESRQQLTDKLAAKIRSAKTMRTLEDIYLPYKPKKKSLAYIARSRGLGPLADEILQAKPGAAALDEVAAKHVDAEKELADKEAVLAGVQHLLAEHFCNHAGLRSMLRQHLWRRGTLVSKKLDQPVDDDAIEQEEKDGTPTADSESKKDAADETVANVEETKESIVDAATNETAAEPAAAEPAAAETLETPVAASSEPDAATADTTAADKSAEEKTPKEKTPKEKAAPSADAKNKKAAARDQRRATRRRRRERLIQSFKDYFDFSDPLGKLPHHRILAINRGERTKVLRVKIECADWAAAEKEIHATAIEEGHPYAEFLTKCLQDSLSRLLIPSIEREVRRELNDKAEEHAVKVFAKNLRKLLLQPPLHQHRVVAIDPGFRSGCKVVALDEFGTILGHTFINLLGKDQQKEQGRKDLAKFAKEHKATVVAVGNGAACRETETLVGEMLGNELKDDDVGYLIVNEAGTSVYSTSEVGREELPDVDPTVRSAVSIGRRSLDPLSELVKVDPASIGVGLYQHDVKAKHLRDSLDDVVESCVNYVGVDVNSASPSLLRYVSGLNKMTANQIYKHREKNGPFKSREEIKAVPGVGEASYVQAAGFLKITRGENPLDGTWIHPESYPIANRVLQAIGFSAADLQAESRISNEPTAAKSSEAVAKVEQPAEPSSVDKPAPEPATAEPKAEPEPKAEAAPNAEAIESLSEENAAAAATETPSESTESTASEVATAAPAGDSNPQPAPPTSSNSSRLAELTQKLNNVDVNHLAPRLEVGKLLLQDILTALARPGRDPREDLPRPPFRKGVLKLEDLEQGMELSGTVLNVVDFGAFVDIGLVDSGLIHVSRLADKYISDPHDVVSVGDILRVWVVEVDNNRRRVSLTAIEPGTERPKRQKESRKSEEGRKPNERRQGGGKQGGGGPRGKQRGGSGKRREDRKGKRGAGKPREFRAKTPPKPVVPITKEMEAGNEPMRTFGDLKQLFEKKKKGDK